MRLLQRLEQELGNFHAHYKIVAGVHMDELRDELETRYSAGKIHAEVYEDHLSGFQYRPAKNGGTDCSVIVIAVPQGMSIAGFRAGTRHLKAVIPPTYIFRKIRKKCLDALSGVLGPETTIEKAVLPLKLLAVRSGLGKYGQNGLCYVAEMGSFTRIEAFYVGRRFDRDDWREPTVMPECGDCARCRDNCPTDCIDEDNPAIDAGRCLTFHNESEREFPEYIRNSAHNALVGCIRCQSVCPVNRKYLKDREYIESFTEEETALILENRHDSSKSLSRKLERHDMDGYSEVITRNLHALLQGRDPRPGARY